MDATTTQITLKPAEYFHAAYAGFFRQATNICRGRVDAYNFNGNGYDVHVLGAIGEYVVARTLGIFWSGPGTLRASDVGRHIQVRTRSRHDYELIVHPNDEDDAPFVLVTGQGLDYVVHGWIMGRDGKQREWWNDPARGRPAYFVPHTALRAMEELVG